MRETQKNIIIIIAITENNIIVVGSQSFSMAVHFLANGQELITVPLNTTAWEGHGVGGYNGSRVEAQVYYYFMT